MNLGKKIYVPAPPEMLSSASCTAHAAATKRHLQNFAHPRSQVQLVPNPADSPRTPRTTTYGTQQYNGGGGSVISPRKGADGGGGGGLFVSQSPRFHSPAAAATTTTTASLYSSTSPRQTITATYKRTTAPTTAGGASAVLLTEDVELACALELTKHTRLQEEDGPIDKGRERAMCSSPRERMTAAQRATVLRNAERAIQFTHNITEDCRKAADVQQDCSPHRDHSPPLDSHVGEGGAASSRTTTVKASQDVAAPAVEGAEEDYEDLSSSPPKVPKISGLHSFLSTSERFPSASRRSGRVPPVGHYHARYEVVDHRPRSARFLGSRPPTAGTEKPAAAAQQPTPPPHNPNSARERAKFRLNSAPPTQRAVVPTSSFKDTVPKLSYLHEAMKRSAQSSSGANRNVFVMGVAHNEDVLSTSPRVQSASLARSNTGRSAVGNIGGSGLDIVSYQRSGQSELRTGRLASAPKGIAPFATLSSRRPLSTVEAHHFGTSVDQADLRVAGQTLVSPRQPVISDFSRESKRPPLMRSSDVPVTVSVDHAPDRRALDVATRKRQPELDFDKVTMRPDPAYPTTCRAEYYPEAIAQQEALTMHRAPQPTLNLHSSHNDAAQREQQQQLHSHDHAEANLYSIDLTRPRSGRNIPNFSQMQAPSQMSPEQRRDAAMRAQREELLNVDSPARQKRVQGDPHLAQHTSRAQNQKIGFQAVAPSTADLVYDVQNSGTSRVPLGAGFGVQIPRADFTGKRIEVEYLKPVGDVVPGPGTYF